MAVHTIAKTRAWCLNCPDGIHPGQPVVIDPMYAKPGSSKQPMVHAECEGLPMYDPDEALG